MRCGDQLSADCGATGENATETLLKLRDAVGETIGANFDLIPMMWMGGEPLKAIRKLGEAIDYGHAKDTRIDHDSSDPNGLLENNM